MNRQIWSGLTTAALIITSLSTASAGSAEPVQTSDDASAANVSLEGQTSEPVTAAAPAEDAVAEDAVKVGEYQSLEQPQETEETIALIHPHLMDGRPAATLYVQNIPVLTFLSSPNAASAPRPISGSRSASADVKVATTSEDPQAITPAANRETETPDTDYTSDPVWRATSIAARLNQLYRDRVDASTIGVRWDAQRQDYIIAISGDELVEVNANTILPDTTSDAAIDALQATNRLRRQMGNAPPLTDIEGRPQPQPQQVSLGSIRLSIRGVASWYGPGFNGNRSANGEIFNQNALTAAHRSLPFGTQVRVTNLRNGQSVVVRINDRGPYSGSRVIDLSAAAARAVGLMQMGVAPVSIDVLGAAGALASQR